MTKTGASMSGKQLARTVIEGKKISFELISGNVVEGYLCGMDDFHWMLITSEKETCLVHKGSASLVVFAPDATYESEENREELDKVVGPFRKWVSKHFFGQGD